MSQLFNKVKVGNASRSTFDLSHHQVTTSDFGYLIPICYRDLLPNDDVVVNPQIFCRLAPLAVPTYGKITCRVHSFFVPYRILYPKWDAFITQDESNNTIPPYITNSQFLTLLNNDESFTGDDGDFPRGLITRVMSNLGINPSVMSDHNTFNDRFAAFPFLAYYRIWLDYFMDSNINSHSSMVESFNQYVANGGSLNSNFVKEIVSCRNVCFKKDYFTTMKQSPQAGNAAKVSVNLADSTENPGLYNTGTGGYGITKKGTEDKVFIGSTPTNPTNIIGSFKVEALRFATALQRYSERSNYVGSKIINQLLAHFGVAPTPERLDMAEFIGGDSFNIQIGDVTSTSQQSDGSTLDTFGLGAQAGKGIGAQSSQEVRYHAKEHGIFMTLMSILPDTGYYQGLSRFWTKGIYGDALDYFTPEFENLGYQEVLNQEFYCPVHNDLDYQSWNGKGILGYVPRFSEYKFQQDVLAGDFVGSDTSGSSGSTQFFNYMDSFHLFRHLSYDDGNPLALNNNLVECDNQSNDYDRIFQINDNKYDHFYFNIDVDFKATRDMVGFAEPSLDAVNNLGDGNSIDLPYGGTRL